MACVLSVLGGLCTVRLEWLVYCQYSMACVLSVLRACVLSVLDGLRTICLGWLVYSLPWVVCVISVFGGLCTVSLV